MSSVGAVIRLSTVDGLDRRSSAIAAGVARPVVATARYASHTSRANRPQAGSAPDTPGRPGAPPLPLVPLPVLPPLPLVPALPPLPVLPLVPVLPPLPKKTPAHWRLNTPSIGPFPVFSGRKERARSFHVIMGTIAS